ncbi:hypothetical protein NL676_012189 [Syzygium grande]|nr:hypothetical protein NL676_012189 [Syzygium grande]
MGPPPSARHRRPARLRDTVLTAIRSSSAFREQRSPGQAARLARSFAGPAPVQIHLRTVLARWFVVVRQPSHVDRRRSPLSAIARVESEPPRTAAARRPRRRRRR